MEATGNDQPGSKHRVLIIGVGSIGERHARCFLTTERAEVGICEINDALRRTVADRYPVLGAFRQVDEALQQPFDAAVVAVPANLHLPIATKLAIAGLHLLIEKPLSTSMDGLDGLEAALDDRRICAVGYNHRAFPALRQMKRALESGRFGRPVQVVCTSGQDFRAARPAYRQIYYTDRATGGGAIQDAMTHMFNFVEWLVGPIRRVAADADHQVIDGVQVEDTVHVLARHGPVMASYSLNQYQAVNELTCKVVCTEGVVRYQLHHGHWQWAFEPFTAWQTETGPPMGRDTTYITQANAFLDAIESKGDPLCTLSEGIQTLRVNLAIIRAWQRGTWEQVVGGTGG